MARLGFVPVLALLSCVSLCNAAGPRAFAAAATDGAAVGVGYHKQAKAATQVAVKKPVRKVIPPIAVTCQHGNQNPPFRFVTCKVKSNLQVPVCPKFTCSPAPPGNCQTGPGAGGISNQACSWSITTNCTVPAPIYPSRGNEWGFGYIFTDPGEVNIQLQSFTRVGFKATVCPP